MFIIIRWVGTSPLTGIKMTAHYITCTYGVSRKFGYPKFLVPVVRDGGIEIVSANCITITPKV